ncbi:MAG: glycosyltransferase [Planctomycetes bacterium]|nr:glycosyltransferase [Planctomycetota bacterium]
MNTSTSQIPKKPDLSIIIPAYNEEKRILITLESYHSAFCKSNISFELIIVLNGCRDNTLDVVNHFSQKHCGVRIYNFHEAIGKGGAILEGIKLSLGDLVCFADADGSTVASELISLYHNMQHYDGIIASRWMKESTILKNQPLHRRFCSRLFNYFVRLVLNINFADTQCGSKVFKREAIQSVTHKIDVRGWAFDAVLLFYFTKEGFQVKEHPITWSHHDASTLDISRTAFEVFTAIISTRLKDLMSK